jgi:phospholipid/cholesterol/gamma-HCH transport system substrate-binding protein
MDLYYKQEITVGVLVITALAIMVAGLLWLTSQDMFGRGKITVPVQFQTVSGLNKGDPVQISGVTVGEVRAVELQEIGRVMVYIRVDRAVRPRVDGRAEIRSLDFLGAKFVAYTPGTAEQLLPGDRAIVGVDETELAASAVALAEEATRTLLRAQDIMSEDVVGQVKATMAAAERALDVVARVGDGPMIESATSSLRSVQSAAASLDSIVSNPSIQESLNQLDEITEGVKEMTDGLASVTQQLALMLEQMRAPEGTTGRLMTDSTLYIDMHETLVALRKLLDDVRERPGRYVNVKVF